MYVCSHICVHLYVCHSMHVEVRGQPQMSVLSFCPYLLLFTAAYTWPASPWLYLISQGWQRCFTVPALHRLWELKAGRILFDYYLQHCFGCWRHLTQSGLLLNSLCSQRWLSTPATTQEERQQCVPLIPYFYGFILFFVTGLAKYPEKALY